MARYRSFFVVFCYSGSEYRNILRRIFRFFVLLFFFFAEASLCSVPKPKLSSFLHLPTAAVADRYTARFY